MAAKLSGVGCGPGDPELLTLKGLRLLREAACVFLPATRPGHSFAGSIVRQYLASEGQEVVELVCPAYRDRAAIERRWEQLAAEVAAILGTERTGVFTCEGDPSLYSTFQYLATALRRHHPSIAIDTVPGVTSVSAAAALSGIPLAMWDERLAILPGPEAEGRLARLLEDWNTIALLKPRTGLPRELEILAGRPDLRIALVRRAGRPEQEVLQDLDAIRVAPPDYFTTLLVRRTAGATEGKTRA